MQKIKNIILYIVNFTLICLVTGSLSGAYFAFNTGNNRNSRHDVSIQDIYNNVSLGFIIGSLPLILIAIASYKKYMEYCNFLDSNPTEKKIDKIIIDPEIAKKNKQSEKKRLKKIRQKILQYKSTNGKS